MLYEVITIAARDIFSMDRLWLQIEQLDNRAPALLLQGIMADLQRLVRRSANWLLNSCRQRIEPQQLVERFRPGVQKMADSLSERLAGEPLAGWQSLV